MSPEEEIASDSGKSADSFESKPMQNGKPNVNLVSKKKTKALVKKQVQ